ncbi:MAG TPA: helix-turn-helix domain-containing protein [Stellaceae bacterium]|nr:helix-turn-helix domain-containing protein [Stellaceae bacterium]
MDARSRPAEWSIREHAHGNLNHVIFMMTGGGEMRAEGRVMHFEAPALLPVPARRIHGFAWYPESTGKVLTVSEPYLAELVARAPPLRRLFESAETIVVPGNEPEHALLMDSIGRLARELSWAAPAHEAAVEAHLMAFLVEALRLAHRQTENAGYDPGPQVLLVARFREALERSFHAQPAIEDYADELGVSVTRLRAACLRVAGQPPGRMAQDRLVLEAKRLLLYSNMTVSEAAYSLGFDDPAYFSRMFRNHTGQSPRGFRHGRTTEVEGYAVRS